MEEIDERLEENTKAKDGPMQGGTDGESPAIHGGAFAKMHAAVPHRKPEMTSKLPLGASRCRYVCVRTCAESPAIAVD